MRNQLVTLSAAALLVMSTGCQEGATEASSESLDRQQHALVPERSLAVTEVDILKPFTLERVLKQLATQSGIPGMDALTLFQQFWDTQNKGPGLGRGAHCDDHFTPSGDPGLNEFKWECERLEGFQAHIDPFKDKPLYMPIGLFNRFDLAPANGAHCGEYRIVFAMVPGHPLAKGKGRNFIIFEAILPNPHLDHGLAGCAPVQELWTSLSDPFMSVSDRQQTLEKFYFDGFDVFEPVVHVNHYGLMLGASGYACSTGQIRTNQFNDSPWTMREYKLTNDCRCGKCELLMVPMTVKTNPYGELFNVATAEPLAPMLQSTIASQIPSLAVNDIDRFGYSVDDSLNAAESPIDDGPQLNHYANQYSFPFNAPFDALLAANLGGTSLAPEHIINRVHALSCAGCHQHSNGADLGDGLIWPNSLGFTHVDEFIDPGVTPPSFRLSEGMHDVFLPFRRDIVETFLAAPDAFDIGGEKCDFEMPPELEMSDAECAESDKKGLSRVFPTKVIRELRMSWEGEKILGRRAGH